MEPIQPMQPYQSMPPQPKDPNTAFFNRTSRWAVWIVGAWIFLCRKNK